MAGPRWHWTLIWFSFTDTIHNHNETMHNKALWNILYLTDDWNAFTTMVTITPPGTALVIFNFTSSTLIPHQEGLFIKDNVHDHMGVSDISTSGIKINLSLRLDCYFIMQIKDVNTKRLVYCFTKDHQLISPQCRIYASVNWVSIGSDNGLSPNIVCEMTDILSGGGGGMSLPGYLVPGSQLNPLRPRDFICWQRSGSILAQVMAWCLTAPSHYSNQCWLITSVIQWHSNESISTRYALAINH